MQLALVVGLNASAISSDDAPKISMLFLLQCDAADAVDVVVVVATAADAVDVEVVVMVHYAHSTNGFGWMQGAIVQSGKGAPVQGFSHVFERRQELLLDWRRTVIYLFVVCCTEGLFVCSRAARLSRSPVGC